MANDQQLPPGTASDPNAPLYSIGVDEGAGAIIGAAAGDVAGGAHEAGYSALTQASTVVAYHLLAHGVVDAGLLTSELLELDGPDGGSSAYRAESPEFRTWLDGARGGPPTVSAERSAEPATRMPPVGLWCRADVGALVSSAVAVARLTHLEAASVVVSAAVAGAVAGASYGQAGLDLVLGAAETAERAVVAIEADRYRLAGSEGAPLVPSRLRELARLAEAPPDEAVGAVTGTGSADAIDEAILAVVLGASVRAEAVRCIEAGAVGVGSRVGAITGAIVGARAGLVRWPWRVPNDTWFAEIGRRLVSRNREIRDLPVPQAVEERTTMMIRTEAGEESL